MKVVNLNLPGFPGEWDSTLAYFDVEVIDGFLLRGCRVVAGEYGNFISWPKRKSRDNEDAVWVHQDVLREIERQLPFDFS